MSRSGYSDDLDNWELIKWRGQVASSIRGKRGQALLLDILRGMDAMPTKELHAEVLVDDENGTMCALGAAAKHRGTDVSQVDEEDPRTVAEHMDCSHQLAAEVAYMNDDWRSETPGSKWIRMHKWVFSGLSAENQELYQREVEKRMIDDNQNPS